MRVKLLLGMGTWLGAIFVGVLWLANYESRPGAQGVAPSRWPTSSQLKREPGRWTLVLFIHPHCPCSGASLQELAVLLTHHASKLRTHIVFCRPPGVEKGWEKSNTWWQACAMDHVEVHCDENDQERQLFDALTSGQVFLYNRDGFLRYSGGITAARGHVGANANREIIESLLSETTSAGMGRETRRPVYGCPLVGPE